MSSRPKLFQRKETLWLVLGMTIGVVISVIHLDTGIPIEIGVATWFVAVALVLVLSASPIGARAAVLIAGLALAVPCHVWSSPLARGFLMCCMFMPFLAATALLLAPPLSGFSARIAYLGTWGGTRPVKWRARGLDTAALLQMIGATAVLAISLAAVDAAGTSGLWLIARWFAGGIAVLAFAEIATASLPLASAAFGVEVSPLFKSPYRAASIGEFWTKRWNIGASEKIFRPFGFAPLARHNAILALLATFALSAVAHVLLAYMTLGRWGISLACGAFFIVQPPFILAERWLGVRRWRRVPAHTWTLVVLAITSPLFVEPVLQMIKSSGVVRNNVLPSTLAAAGFVMGFSIVVSLASLVAGRAAGAEPKCV